MGQYLLDRTGKRRFEFQSLCGVNRPIVKSYPNQIKDGANSILEITGGRE
jgi:hypothetical protein